MIENNKLMSRFRTHNSTTVIQSTDTQPILFVSLGVFCHLRACKTRDWVLRTHSP